MSAPQTRSRSSFSTTSVLFVTAGDVRRATGGNVYARHLQRALRRAGARVTTLSANRALTAADRRAMRPDIAIIDTIAAPAAGPIIRALRAQGARVVTLALMSRGAAGLGRESDLVIAVSAALARELRAAGIPPARIQVIAPGTSRVARPRAASRMAQSPSRVRDVRVLCVANWTRAKGVHTLLAAARQVPEISIDLVGARTDASYARQIRGQIARSEISGRVRVHGAITGARLGRLYRAAAIFALPSTLESYGMAVGEALAHGLPVVACDIPATREVTRGAALLVPPGRVALLAAALRSLARDGRQRNTLAQRARKRATTLPTWDRCERELVRAVLGAVSARGAGARRTRAGRPS